jgi:integrase
MRATGLRRREALDLKVDSLRKISGGQWALHVPLGKLHNERVVPIDERTARIFDEIVKLRGSPPPVEDPETGKLAHFLVLRRDGRRFTRDCFRYHLETIEREAQLKEHPTPHRLRHCFATEMLRSGMSLPVLMKLLGHRSIGMTLRYAEVTGVDVRRAYFEALEFRGRKYEVPMPPVVCSPTDRKLTSWSSVASQIEAFSREVESFRRDSRTSPQARPARRLVERLRRIARDFKNLGA